MSSELHVYKHSVINIKSLGDCVEVAVGRGWTEKPPITYGAQCLA